MTLHAQQRQSDSGPGIAPGLYENIPFADYLLWPFLSQSTLKRGRDSMKHLRHALDLMRAVVPTDDMTLGSALHTAFLEPGEMPNRVVCYEGDARRGKEWTEFRAVHSGKIILTKGYYSKLFGMVQALRANAEVAKWSKRIQAVEISCVGELQGLMFKARADALTDAPLWDLKKISCTDDRTVNSTLWDYGYHIQAHIYCKLFKRDRFCLGFVEGDPPHDVRVIELSERWIKIGEQETTDLINRYKSCLRDKRWPGRFETVDVVEPPDWVAEQFGVADEITIGGEKAFA